MSETKKILVTKFVKQYKELTDDKLKDRKVKSIIRRTYCPIFEKKIILDLMLSKSINEEGSKHIDLFVNRINFIGAIIALYTNLLLEKDDNDVSKTYEMYDLLVENDILNKIFENIGEKEIGELTSINGIVMDNWYAANTSTEAYVNNIIDTASRRFGISIDLVLDKLTDILEDDAKTKKVTTILEKLAKKIK